jgi:hypothetical protein
MAEAIFQLILSRRRLTTILPTFVFNDQQSPKKIIVSSLSKIKEAGKS